MLPVRIKANLFHPIICLPLDITHIVMHLQLSHLHESDKQMGEYFIISHVQCERGRPGVMQTSPSQTSQYHQYLQCMCLSQGLKMLSRLYLDGNLLEAVPSALPPSLQELKLSENKLRRIDENSFQGTGRASQNFSPLITTPSVFWVKENLFLYFVLNFTGGCCWIKHCPSALHRYFLPHWFQD